MHARLAPYVRALSDEAVATGLPLQRPLFLHYADPEFHDIQDQYLYGTDLLVAPVVAAGEDGRNVRLPEGQWRHLWSGDNYAGGLHMISAPAGNPPVFYRQDSAYAPLFASITEEFGT